MTDGERIAEFEAQLAEATIRKAELEGLVNVAAQQVEECAAGLRSIARERDEANRQAEGFKQAYEDALVGNRAILLRLEAAEAQLAEANVATATRPQTQQLAPLAAASIATEAQAGDCLNCGRPLPGDGDCYGCAADIAWADLKAAIERAEAAEADARRLRAALQAYPEWLNETDEDGIITGTQYCLVCNETELHGHKSDCLRVLALQAADERPDCGHPFRVGDVCPTCVAADAKKD